MNSAQRAGVGAVVGAILVLAFHPATRSFFVPTLTAFGRMPEVDSSPLQALPQTVPEKLLTVQDAAVWIESASKQKLGKAQLRDSERAKLAKVFEFAKENDPLNAYWPLAEANLIFAPTTESWKRAAGMQAFNDYQSNGIISSSKQMEKHGAKAWRWSVLSSLRSEATSTLCEATARDLNRSYPLDIKEGLEIRFATLRNGVLLRDGSRNIRNGDHGQLMVELSTYPAELRDKSPKRLLLAQVNFLDLLRANQMVLEATTAQSAFRDNEAWLALVERNEAKKTLRFWAQMATFAALTPAVLTIMSVFSAVVLVMGLLSRKLELAEKLVRPPWPIVVGLISGLTLFILIGQFLVACAVALCNFFLLAQSPTRRSKAPNSLGPLFMLTCTVVTLATSLFGALFYVGLLAPAIHSLEALNTPPEYFAGSTLFAGLAITTSVLLCVIAPSWGFAFRVDTGKVLELALIKSGKASLGLSIVLAIVSAPVCVALDRAAENHLVELTTNEPLYYYRH